MNFYFFVKDCKAFHFKYGNLETIVLSVIISGAKTRLWRNNLKQDCSTKKSHPVPHPSFSLSVPLNLPFFCCTPLSSASPVDYLQNLLHIGSLLHIGPSCSPPLPALQSIPLPPHAHTSERASQLASQLLSAACKSTLYSAAQALLYKHSYMLLPCLKLQWPSVIFRTKPAFLPVVSVVWLLPSSSSSPPACLPFAPLL